MDDDEGGRMKWSDEWNTGGDWVWWDEWSDGGDLTMRRKVEWWRGLWEVEVEGLVEWWKGLCSRGDSLTSSDQQILETRLE
ncbi:hypothetical protein E2C01_043555 [Portunus trituberculatus]|uniref:Uncharacterized protein n=1 Tax=Portunus trituberculatus TaxID=210409 RepID=A0A5B7FT94_PORTR|nr:hypothetical protein [Portunus trituberculatus]